MAENSIQQEVRFIGMKIDELKYDIAKKMARDGNVDEQAMNVRLEFLQMVVDAFKSQEDVMDQVTTYGRKTGELAIKYGAKMEESLKATSHMRATIWNSIKGILLDKDFSLETAFEVADIVNPLLDQAVYAFSTAYIESYRERIEKAHEDFMKLSAPVVPLIDSVAVLPIIGGVSTERAEQLMNKALSESNKMDLSHLFIDLSGVPLVDTTVAYNIYKIFQSLEMVGVETVIAGIRPEVAHTMVSLGIDFRKIETYSSLQQALSRHKVFSAVKKA
ncbi:rsbT co-antagonist protein RsbR [Virgibacillus subterraneus]|uniref:RsbT co-antagonist protein RsbR n=1 Tax=Virgibacillus subterraneus TaxID=621109 RepID=A0A1H9ICV2_9BACI|nr:STAS domain-containing protein [Virgibacillus subterraneus]SEQ72387.1 rsbT co-antagonist protein RsbR [Virgibacillus subterraneus]